MAFPIEAYRDHRATGKTHDEALALVRDEQARQQATKRKSPPRDDDWRGRNWR